MAAAAPPKLLTQAEFAKRRGVSRKAVTSWKQKGLLALSEDGRVDVEASEWNLDQRPATYRGGVTHRPVRRVEGNSAAPKGNTPKPTPIAPALPSEIDAPVDPEALGIDLDDPNLPLPEAVRRKENYLGLLRRRDLEISDREWVRVEDVATEVEREYSTIRERMLILPGKVAALLVGMERADIEALLRREITEALSELHDPDGLASRLAAADEAAAGQAGA